MSEFPTPYAGHPRHNPGLQSQVVQLARTLAGQPNDDLFALFCVVYYTARGESPAIRDRLRRLVELIAEHPDKAALWAGMNSDYAMAVRKDAGLIAEMQAAGERKKVEEGLK